MSDRDANHVLHVQTDANVLVIQAAYRTLAYLRWLSRHSAGMRFRAESASTLADAPAGPTASEKVFGRR